MTSAVIQGPYPDVEIPDQSLPAFVLADALQHADKPALIDGPSGRTLTYGQLAAGVERVAAGLAERGLGKGDVLAIYSPNLPEYALAFYGAAAAGGIATTINPLYTVDELAVQLQDTGARYLLTVPPFLDQARQAAARTGVQEVLVFGEGSGATPFATLLGSQAPPPRVAIDPATDLAALPYSSGTTGLPKGVMLTHRNLVATVCLAQPVLAASQEAVFIGVLPLFHVYGLALLLGGVLHTGATMVTMPRFDLEEFLRLLQDYRVTHAALVPPLVLALAKHPLVDRYDLSALREVGSGAAPLGANLQDSCAGRLGCAVRQGLGMTECPVVAINPPDAIRPGSVGVLLPNTQARVVDPLTGVDVPRGATGELWVRGPQVMRGYLHHPEATARMLDADGWLHSGDLGYADADADGYLYVVDRLKELIKYKGFQVAPAELEAVLLGHPAIDDAAVIGSPDEEAGEVPKAFVVARSPLTADQVMAFVAERVAPHKKVRRVEFVDEIPKALSGKILRRVLIERDRARSGAL